MPNMILSQEFKEIVKNSRVKAELSLAMGISYFTLNRWVKLNHSNLTKSLYQDDIVRITGLQPEEIFLKDVKIEKWSTYSMYKTAWKRGSKPPVMHVTSLSHLTKSGNAIPATSIGYLWPVSKKASLHPGCYSTEAGCGMSKTTSGHSTAGHWALTSRQ